MVRETLTREQIVAATIEMLDTDGIETLSMRKLGQKLGSAATSMYWHVDNKQNLIALASDHVWNEVELPDIDREGWRVAAAALAWNTYDVLIRHHWLAPATSTYFAYGPGMARYQDHSYAVYETAGFEGTDADWAYSTMFHFVLGTALSDSYGTAMRARLDEDGEAKFADMLRYGEETASVFPRLKARIDAHHDIESEAATLGSLDFGIDAILDGLEARLAQRS